MARGAGSSWVGFRMQPSELSKLSLAIFLAYFLERRAGEERSFWGTFFPCAVVTGVLAVLIVAEPDLGTAMMLVVIFGVLIYTAGARLLHLGLVALPALIGLAGLLIFVPFRMRRMIMFLDPWADPQGSGFQVVQSLIAIGSGGPNGLGFAQGKQKMLFLPFAHSDFIFAVVGEELGLVGTLTVLAGFRTVSLARHSHVAAGAGSFRHAFVAGPGDRDRGASAFQYERGAFAGADERNSFAVYFLRRIVAGSDARRRWYFAEYLATHDRFIRPGTSEISCDGQQQRIEETDRGAREASGVVALWIANAVQSSSYSLLFLRDHSLKADSELQLKCDARADCRRRNRRTHLSGNRGGERNHAPPPGSEIRFVGTARGLENKLVPQAGFELSIIESAGLKNVGLTRANPRIDDSSEEFVGGAKLLREFRPDIVIGAGGYVSGPVF